MLILTIKTFAAIKEPSLAPTCATRFLIANRLMFLCLRRAVARTVKKGAEPFCVAEDKIVNKLAAPRFIKRK